MTIRAVIFDRDNTLLQFDQRAIATLETQITAIAPALPSGAAAQHWITWPGPWPYTEADEPAFWQLFWSNLAGHYGLSATTAATLQSIGAFYHTCFVAFPDAANCVSTLRARGFRLAVLTNYELPSISQTLCHAGLDPDLFAALLSSTGIGVRKPDPRAYLIAAGTLGLSPAECAFVDDLLVNVEAARKIGMQGWLLDRKRMLVANQNERAYTIDSLVALLEQPELSIGHREFT